jgi:PAS domain S-box-containing protein
MSQQEDFFDRATDIIFAIDLAGTVTFINRAGLTIGGRDLVDVVGKPFTEFIVPEDIHLAARMMQRKLNGDVCTTVYEVRFTTRDGRKVPVEISSWLVYESGKPVGIQGIARDVSEREQLVQQLMQAKQDEVVGKLAGGVAHDFNNLLTVILGRSELLKGRVTPNHPMRAEIDFISEAAERAAVITRQLLAFSRKQIPMPIPLDLNALILKMRDWLQRLVGEHVRLDTFPAEDLNAVRADPVQIEQVILNLALNARDAMPKGGTFTIETSNVVVNEGGVEGERHSPYVLLSISDTGKGIDSQTISHLFEPFSTTKKGGGFGLGLSTVERIVSLAGGFTKVESELGKGTTFKIYLPSVLDAPEVKKTFPVPFAGGTETVFVVDDEGALLSLVSENLEMDGYKVLRARSAEEAIRICEQYDGPIHLLLSDVVMQNMSGVELAETLAGRNPNLKVLLMSGYPDEVLSHHGVRQGSKNLLEKPFTRTQLALKVREVLDLL